MDNTYAITELVGSSKSSIEEAIGNALSTASGSLKHLEWFEVTQIRGHLKNDGSIGHYQVGLKLGFRYQRED